MTVLERLKLFNAVHPWSHNDAFAGFVIRYARAVRRAGGSAALDVGCGTGNLLERLSHVLPKVVGVEPDAQTALVATRRFERSSVEVDVRPFGGESRDAYDLIVFAASLHHMPLKEALSEARSALRPAGRIVIVGVARETRSDQWRSMASLALNPVIGFLRHPSRASAPPLSMRAPTADSDRTFEEIQAIAAEVLPNVRMRRRLFWR